MTPVLKNKTRFFTFYKWAAIICSVLTIIFLLVGIIQSVAGAGAIDPLKADFSNLSKEKPVSIILDEAENIGVEYTARTGRRSTTTYNYFLVKTQNKKLILETTDKEEVKKGASINIKNDISATTAENQNNIKTLAIKNNTNENTKLSEQDLLDLKFVKHYTDGDKLSADYWGWIAALIFLVCTIVFGIRYWWDKRNYTIALEDVKNAHSSEQNSGTPINLAASPSPMQQKTQGLEVSSQSASNFIKADSELNNAASAKSSYQASPILDQVKPKSNKTTYVLLAIFLGIFGVHHFYNHKIIYGFLHLIWLFCFVVPFFAMDKLALIFLLAFILLPITFIVSLIQALVKGLSKD